MTFKQKAGYGLGIFGPMLGWVAAMQYLMFFYTEIVGLAPERAGLIFLLGMLWDAVSDPLIGAIADRTKSRWGRYRPYLLFGAVPYGLSVALLFTPPSGSETLVFLAALAAHLLFRTGYTLVYMPYTAMIAQITSEYDSRSDLTAFKTFFVFTANLSVSFGFYTLVLWFGEGQEKAGFLPSAILLGILSACTAWLCFAFTEERVETEEARLAKRTPLRFLLRDLAANRPFVLVFLGVAIFGGFYGAALAMVPYFAKYWFGDAGLSRVLFTTQAVCSLASIPLWHAMARRLGKKQVWLCGTGLAAAGLLTLYLITPSSVWVAAAIYGVANAGATGFILIFYAMTADTVDWGEWRTGRRQEGVIFGAISFANKLAAGLATGAVGTALAWIGFVTDADQSEATLAGMRTIGLLVPAVAFLAATALLLRYPITREKHQEIMRTISA